MRNFMKAWIRYLKLKFAIQWANQFGLQVVNMQQRAGTNYIVDSEDNWLKIGRAPAGVKRSIKG
ncbi:MAG TPA: hypothetical protein VMV70_01200 [Gallionella sp.]|nr:hypothetical protein [Gallionella sp.]